MQTDIEYQLIVSARAKRASLRVIPGRGLVVSIPKRFPKREVGELIARHRDWILSSLAEIDASTPLLFRVWPPQELALNALGICMQLHYRGTEALPADTESRIHRRVLAPVEDKAGVAQEIARHLKKIARTRLPSWLAAFADLHGFHYKRVSIRGQRTVWGSYSTSGTLSLNYKLLFLSRELVNYVLLHELAHTKHMDHSPAFWKVLCQLNVNARVLDEQLRTAGLQVPPWLELAR